MTTQKLFRVPFSFTTYGTFLTVASDEIEARENAEGKIEAHADLLDESNVFWEEGTPILDQSIVGPNLGVPLEITGDKKKELDSLYEFDYEANEIEDAIEDYEGDYEGDDAAPDKDDDKNEPDYNDEAKQRALDSRLEREWAQRRERILEVPTASKENPLDPKKEDPNAT